LVGVIWTFLHALKTAKDGDGIAIIPTILLVNFEGKDEMVTPFAPSIRSAEE
jgi:hypothetical protein